MFFLVDFVYLIQELWGNCFIRPLNSRVLSLSELSLSLLPLNSRELASESNKQIPRDKTLDLLFYFRNKRIIPLKNHAQRESLPYWFWDNVCGRVCFYLLVERISFVCSH